MVTVCYYSRYFEVDRLDSTFSEAVTRKLEKLIANQGIPEKFISLRNNLKILRKSGIHSLNQFSISRAVQDLIEKYV